VGLPERPGPRDRRADLYEAGGVVAAVCHGPAALVGITLSDGRPLVEGKEVAAFTNAEEEAAGLTESVPFLLQARLEELGAKHTAAADFQPHVVADGRLVTGQNPASATGVARAVVAALEEESGRTGSPLGDRHPQAPAEPGGVGRMAG
jgi:putative intracellular protease/amidase